MQITLHIGGLNVALDEPDGHPVTHWPVPMYEQYCSTGVESPDLRFSVSVVGQVPVFPTDKLLFDAEHGQWRLYGAGAEYLFESLDPMTLRPRCRALLTRDFTAGHVWVTGTDTEEPIHWNPLNLINPLLTACLLSRLTRRGGLLLHAAGVMTDEGVWVFTGESGSGKSTLSGWCRARGMAVLNDERIIITRRHDGLGVWGTPWVGTEGVSLNQCGPLSRLHCIRHGTHRHTMRPLSSMEASQLILRQCTIPHWDREGVEGMLRFLHNLITDSDCVDLAFVKNANVLDYLRPSSTVLSA
jgi:hypothetical protein